MNDNRPAEFDARVLAYVPGLRKLASRYTHTAEQREDLVNDTIMYALERWQNFREDGGFWTWLTWQMRGIVKNAAKSSAARRKRVNFVALEDSHQPSTPASQDDAAYLGQVLSCLDRLDTDTRSCVLRIADGDSLEAIATDYGVSKQAISQRAQRARAGLADGVAVQSRPLRTRAVMAAA